MSRIQHDMAVCADCKFEFPDTEWDGDKCPKCGSNAIEELLSNEWQNMTEEEREAARQNEEDNSWYNSVRI